MRIVVLLRGELGESDALQSRMDESEEGCAVRAPGLPGCVSQGETRELALINIADAIREYLDAVRELTHTEFRPLL